jgi:uncharacterized protein YjbI with pentapeptide repeats
MMTTSSTRVAIVLLSLFTFTQQAQSEDSGPVSPDSDFTAHHITNALYKAVPGERVNFSGRDLTYLDLSDLNFKGAILARSDFYGTDFTGANLSGADLSHTRLDRSVLIRADLSGANLTGATIYRPTIYSDMASLLSDAPRFSGANLTNVRVQAELSGADFRGANLTNANFSPLEERPGQGTLMTLSRNVLKSCDFSGARMHNANMTRAVLLFARFTGADLTGAKLAGADLSRTDFSGADLTGADLTEADLDGANFNGTKGLDSVIGLATAHNFDRIKK